ncbi:MAG: Do family serine endopeptidase [Pseudomonadota bacterium]
MNTLPRVIPLFVFLLLIASALPVHAHDGVRSIAPVLKKVTPAVVNISVSATQQARRNPLLEDPRFRRFFNIPEGGAPRQRRSQSVGSGVIVDADEGLVVTNHHVVNGADAISVTLQDRRRVEAELVGSDPGTDIALLRIDAEDLTDLPLGDSERVEVGDFVAAIGNPFGLGQTVTSGIVSALGRSGVIREGFEDFIQTDASINPGNSGGALIDLDGRLLGINTAIIAPAGGNVGIGFAVPVNMMKSVVDQLLEFGEIRRGQLGVIIQDVTPELAEALELPAASGALVAEVVADSAAAAAGIEVGDVVVRFDDEAVEDGADLRNRVGLVRAGESVRLEVLREGRRLKLKAKVGGGSSSSLAAGIAAERLEGASFGEIATDHPLAGEVSGVQVLDVTRGSTAARFGLRPGDIILSVNRRPVPNVSKFSELVGSISGAMAMHVQRGQSRLFVVVQ